MALHELAPNALKYGGLKSEGGHVELSWEVEGGRLHLVWRERGGPLVGQPSTRGFGTRMIEKGLSADLQGLVSIEFNPEGLVCTVDAPLPKAGSESVSTPTTPHV